MTAALKTVPVSRAQVQADCLRRALSNFEGTGVTDNGGVSAGSSRVLPEPTELAVDTFGGSPSIIRRCGDDSVMVAGPAVENLGAEAGREWLLAYTMANRDQRAEMVGVDDPMRVSRAMLESVSQKASGYASKVKLEVADKNGVQVGGSDEVKRVRWNGHGGFALARWCGAAGWSGAEAVAVFEALGIPLGKSAIIGGVYAGKRGKRGDPAPVTAAQASVLEAKRSSLPKAAPATPKSPKVVAVVAPPVVTPKVKGKGSRKKAHEAKVMAEVAKRKKAGRND